jgi:hypothetical protein
MQERRERTVPRDKPFPHVQPCRERHAIVGVWLVGSRLAVELSWEPACGVAERVWLPLEGHGPPEETKLSRYSSRF